MAIGRDTPGVTIVHEARGTSEVEAANRRVEQSTASVGTSLQTSGQLAGIAANQYLELAKKALGAGQAIANLAASGAQANTIQASFDQLGISFSRLEDATRGTIDATSLQTIALRALSDEGLRLTSRELENLGKLAVAQSAKTGKAVKDTLLSFVAGESEAIAKSGIVIDKTGAAWKGLSEAQQKAKIVQELVSLGAHVTNEELDTQFTRAQAAQTAWANLESTIQQTSANFLEQTGILAGVQDGFNQLNADIATTARILGIAEGKANDYVRALTAVATEWATTGPIYLHMKALGAVDDLLEVLIDDYGTIVDQSPQTVAAIDQATLTVRDQAETVKRLTDARQKDVAEIAKWRVGLSAAQLAEAYSAETISKKKRALEELRVEIQAYGGDLAAVTRELQAASDAESAALRRTLDTAAKAREEAAKKRDEAEKAAAAAAKRRREEQEAEDLDWRRYQIESTREHYRELIGATWDYLGELGQAHAQERADLEEYLQLADAWHPEGVVGRVRAAVTGQLKLVGNSVKETLAAGAAGNKDQARYASDAIELGRSAVSAAEAIAGGSAEATKVTAFFRALFAEAEAMVQFGLGNYVGAASLQMGAIAHFATAVRGVTDSVGGRGGGASAAPHATSSSGSSTGPIQSYGGFRAADGEPDRPLYLVIDGQVFGRASLQGLRSAARYGSSQAIPAALLSSAGRTWS